MSEFDGLRKRKHEKTQHALVELGNAAHAAAVQVSRPKFPKRDNKVSKKKKKKESG